MKKQLLIAALVGTGFGLATSAQAEEDELAVLPEFEAVDANENGMIDKTEAQTLTKTLEEQHDVEFQFERVDENSDGMINNQEYVAYDRMLGERLGIA